MPILRLERLVDALTGYFLCLLQLRALVDRLLRLLLLLADALVRDLLLGAGLLVILLVFTVTHLSSLVVRARLEEGPLGGVDELGARVGWLGVCGRRVIVIGVVLRKADLLRFLDPCTLGRKSFLLLLVTRIRRRDQLIEELLGHRGVGNLDVLLLLGPAPPLEHD